jgi:ribosomal protein L18E
MSVITNKSWQFSTPSVVANFAQKAIQKLARLFKQVAEANAESRKHRAAIENEIYHYRYRHSSKNDDDLPVVR